MKRKAFTLVELLVVIAIIGLLSTVAVVNLNSSRMKARNAKRMADIKQFITVFNTGLNISGSLPTQMGCISTVCSYGWSGVGADGTVDAFIAPYMASKPVNPIPSPAIGANGYIFIGSWGGGGGYPAGPILDWTLEGAQSCNPGNIWSQSSSYTECIYQFRND